MSCPTCRSDHTSDVPPDKVTENNPWKVCTDCGTWFRKISPTDAAGADITFVQPKEESDDATSG